MERVIEIENRFADRCKHNKFVVNPKLGYVECGICGKQLNPMWVIEQYANSEHRLFQQFERLKRLIEETKNKTKCKCQHCGQMTSIASKQEVNKTYYG